MVEQLTLKQLEYRVPEIGVFNNENSFLAKHSDICLPIFAGPQLACGSKTNLASIAILMLLAEKALGHDFQEVGQHLLTAANNIEQRLACWENQLAPAIDFLEGSTYTVFFGRGPARATALFASIFFREVPKLVADGMGAAVLRHGLYEMIRPDHRVVLFAPDGETYPLLIRLAENLRELGVPVLLVSNREMSLKPRKNLCLIYTDPVPEL
jgi:glucosamine--fructose-6-phosphate aminotransferase (isomerizing)